MFATLPNLVPTTMPSPIPVPSVLIHLRPHPHQHPHLFLLKNQVLFQSTISPTSIYKYDDDYKPVYNFESTILLIAQHWYLSTTIPSIIYNSNTTNTSLIKRRQNNDQTSFAVRF